MPAQPFAPGFRLSATDVFVLVFGAIALVVLVSLAGWTGLVIGLPLAHFFLFCNVFRVSRPLELLWAGIFVALATATILWGTPGWWATTFGSLVVGAFVIGTEMRRPSYHGIGWQRINPGLPSWWQARGET